MKIFYRALLPIFVTMGFYGIPAISYSEIVIQNNKQTVDIGGGVINKAESGGNAEMNVASTLAKQNSSDNRQQVQINGAVINAANAGAVGKMNIASKTEILNGKSGKQTVMVNGSTVNVVSGRGSKSEVNIATQK